MGQILQGSATSASTRCSRSMIASMRFSRRLRTFHARLFTTACAVTASVGSPMLKGDKEPKRKKFKACPIGYFHIDIAEVQTAEGKLYLFVAIGRTDR